MKFLGSHRNFIMVYIYLYIYLFIYLYVCRPILVNLSIPCLCFVVVKLLIKGIQTINLTKSGPFQLHSSIYLPICLPIHPSVYLSIHPYLSIHLYLYRCLATGDFIKKVLTATCGLRDRQIVSIEQVYTPSTFYMKPAVYSYLY